MAKVHCEAPCVKSRSQNWDPTSWRSHPKSFQVSLLETASVKIQAPKLRSQILKTMSWKPCSENHILKFPRPQSWDPKSWKPYPKISQAPKSAGPVSRSPCVFTATYTFLFAESFPSYGCRPVLGPSLFSVSSGRRKLALRIPSILSAH